MSQAIKHPAAIAAPEIKFRADGLLSFLPVVLAVGGAVALSLLRWRAGGEHFPSDGALMMLALACYLTAAVFHLTNLYAPSTLFQRIGLWTATGGVFFNLASWLVRWVATYEREIGRAHV